MVFDSEKMKFIGGVDFDDLRAQRVQLYNKIEVSLENARDNEEMVFTGNYIYGLEASSNTANLDVRLNEKFRGTVNILKGRGIRAPFYRFYLSNAAQSGQSITLVVGIEAEQFEVIDNLTAISVSGTLTIIEQNLADGWDNSGTVSNPAANQTLNDTGQLTAGIYDFLFYAASNVSGTCDFLIQHRDAPNTGNVKTQRVWGPTAYPGNDEWRIYGRRMAQNERMRVRITTAQVGVVHTGLLWVRRQ